MKKTSFYFLITVIFILNGCGGNDQSGNLSDATIQGGPPHSDQYASTPYPPVNYPNQNIPSPQPSQMEPVQEEAPSEVIIVQPEPSADATASQPSETSAATPTAPEVASTAGGEITSTSTSASSNTAVSSSVDTSSSSTSASSTEVVAMAPEPAVTTEIPVVVEPVLSPIEKIFKLADASDLEKDKAKIVIRGLPVHIMDYTFQYNWESFGSVKTNSVIPGFDLATYELKPLIFDSLSHESYMLYHPTTWKFVHYTKDNNQAQKDYATQIVKRLAMFHDDLSHFFPLEKVFKYVNGGLVLCLEVSCGSALKGHKQIYQGATPMRFHYNPDEFGYLRRPSSLVDSYTEELLREERLADIHEFGHFIIFNAADYGVDITGFKDISWKAYSTMTEKMKAAGITDYSYPFSWCRQSSVSVDFITSYACLNNYEEDFGDSLGYYVIRHNQFLQKAANSEALMKKYNWIRDNIFHGKEFPDEDLSKIFAQ